jgi:nitrite reductase/ring-hydroxylating ferredoxin subunit
MDKCTKLSDEYCGATKEIISSRKEVDFEKGKVLVARIGDKIHATSAFCTHYGAPLAKGVLTADARVVWYVHAITWTLYN